MKVKKEKIVIKGCAVIWREQLLNNPSKMLPRRLSHSKLIDDGKG